MDTTLNKYVDNPLSYGPDKWQWVDQDFKSFNIFDTVKEIDEWIDLCKGFDVAIQAGGNFGIWPVRMSQIFNSVYTFEPDPEIVECLINNIVSGADGDVKIFHAALSNEDGRRVAVHRDEVHINNYGAGYIVDGDQCSTMTIDDLGLDACDLICLDIEGAELDALKGGEETISKHKPLIVVEDKPMPQLRHFNRSIGSPGAWLRELGYREAKKVHWDTIYAC